MLKKVIGKLKIKKNFWKCTNEKCEFQTTLESEKLTHQQPHINDEGLLIAGHKLRNMKN